VVGVHASIPSIANLSKIYIYIYIYRTSHSFVDKESISQKLSYLKLKIGLDAAATLLNGQ